MTSCLTGHLHFDRRKILKFYIFADRADIVVKIRFFEATKSMSGLCFPPECIFFIYETTAFLIPCAYGKSFKYHVLANIVDICVTIVFFKAIFTLLYKLFSLMRPHTFKFLSLMFFLSNLLFWQI